MQERLHDGRILVLPHPVRIDAVTGEPADTALFEHWGILTELRPHFIDATTPTEAIINHGPQMQQISLGHLAILGGQNMGSFMLTMNRARLRAHGDPILEVTAPLQALLAETDLQEGLPVCFFRNPDLTMVYIALARPSPLRIPHRLSGLHECEGAYIGMYDLPPHHPMLTTIGRYRALRLDPGQPTRAIEIVLTGSPVGKKDALDDASQDLLLLVQNEHEDLASVLERHIAFYNTPAAYSQPGMAPLDPHEAGMMKPVIYELAKVLLYLNLADAERTPQLERTRLERRLRMGGKPLSSKRRERLALVYDRTLIGPLAIPDAAPVAAGENAERTVRPHWRRGHFKRIRYGEGHSQSRIDWIRPTLVNAAEAFKAATAGPVASPPEG
ncbi:MAG: hypothetical protein KDJ28_11140 [Candidatus Competibacteraceae bacterium]|nr:hypothetical protein [Candidatus Competibacteraceae bacterium]